MDQALIDEAATSLGVTDLVAFKPSGQKFVAKALRGSDAVVIKVVELTGPHREVTLERARREVDLLTRVNHPNVVRVLTALEELGGKTPGGVSWLEEYLEGDDLSNHMGSPWDWESTSSMATDVAHGLAALHDEKAVHRDLSPANVRCTASGLHVIMDPGLARHFEQSSLTGVFQPGTLGHMTPEHAAMTRPTPASDVFATGILMYQALTGARPFEVGPDLDRYRVALRDEQAASVLIARPDLTEEQAAIVDRCLQRQSARRFLDGSELASALEAL